MRTCLVKGTSGPTLWRTSRGPGQGVGKAGGEREVGPDGCGGADVVARDIGYFWKKFEHILHVCRICCSMCFLLNTGLIYILILLVKSHLFS